MPVGAPVITPNGTGKRASLGQCVGVPERHPDVRATETKEAAEKDRDAFMDRARKCVDPFQLRGSSAGHYFVLVEQRVWGPYKSAEDAALDAERYLRGEPAIIVNTAKAG